MKHSYRKLIKGQSRAKLSYLRKSVPGDLRYAIMALIKPKVRQIPILLRELKGAYIGERCFLMGNGPSLNIMDLNLFRNEYVWGSNKCYLLFDEIDWRPSFYTAVDTRVVPDSRIEINNLVRDLPSSLFFFPADFCFNNVIASRPNVRWFKQKPKKFFDSSFGMFSIDVSSWVYSVQTVTLTMMQLAAYMGFNPIYLIGCDTNYSLASTTIIENDDNTLLISTEDDDPNHFTKNYFGKGDKWHTPNPDKMIWQYKQAKSVCDSLGIRVLNATVGGKLEVFPRIDYNQLF